MYRQTRKSKAINHQMKMMREARERKRQRYAQQRNEILPDLRIRITVERFDCGEQEQHVFELRQGKRIDMYRVYVDGEPWKHCGLSAVLAGIRKSMPRVLAEHD